MSDVEKVRDWLQTKKLIHPLSGLNLTDLSKALVATANARDTRLLFVLLDGLGSELLRRTLPPDAFLRKHHKRDILSVFPATTTAALTSLATAKHPSEHGLLGWQQRIFHRGSQEFTDAFVLPWVRAKDHASLDRIPGVSAVEYFDFDSHLGSEIQVPFAAFSEYADSHFTKASFGKKAKTFRTSGDDLIDSLEHVKSWWSQHNSSFAYVYCKNPDYLEHEYGITSSQVASKLTKINSQLEAFVNETSNFTNRMIVICADHGQIDAELIDVRPSLHDLCDISCELRTPVFFPKTGVSDEVLLSKLKTAFDPSLWAFLTPSEAVDLRLFGRVASQKALKQMGSFVGITNSKQAIKEDSQIVGIHAGCLPEEMQIPLIVFGDTKHEIQLGQQNETLYS